MRESSQERADAIASGVGGIACLGLALWGTVRVFQGADSLHPNPLWLGEGWSAPGAFLVIVLCLFGVALLFRAVFKWRMSRNNRR